MPSRFPRPCLIPGCPYLIKPGAAGSRCKAHAREHERDRSRQRDRPSTAARMGPGWDRISKRVLKRDSYTCYWCGEDADTADHLIPRSKGGGNDDQNLVASCRSCNSRRGNRG